MLIFIVLYFKQLWEQSWKEEQIQSLCIDSWFIVLCMFPMWSRYVCQINDLESSQEFTNMMYIMHKEVNTEVNFYPEVGGLCLHQST